MQAYPGCISDAAVNVSKNTDSCHQWCTLSLPSGLLDDWRSPVDPVEATTASRTTTSRLVRERSLIAIRRRTRDRKLGLFATACHDVPSHGTSSRYRKYKEAACPSRVTQ